MSSASPTSSANAQRYWARNVRLTVGLLLVWFLVTFVGNLFARKLNFIFLGWPLHFWLAAQGTLVVYGVLVVFYVWYMNRLDRHSQPTDSE